MDKEPSSFGQIRIVQKVKFVFQNTGRCVLLSPGSIKYSLNCTGCKTSSAANVWG